MIEDYRDEYIKCSKRVPMFTPDLGELEETVMNPTSNKHQTTTEMICTD